MSEIRLPAVAGSFYPGGRGELERVLAELLGGSPAPPGPPPKAVIAPHAGYPYSGPVAASAYRCVAPARGRVRRVVLLGPSHRVALRGLAVPSARAFATPLGEVPVDRAAVEALLRLPGVAVRDDAHGLEHSLEVHLPFLQSVLGELSLVPLVVGEASPPEVAQVLAAVWDGPETLVVVSSDLSHYLPYEAARRRDEATARAIEELRLEDLGDHDACGRAPVRGLLYLARERGLRVRRVDLRNSGDTAGDRRQVVGYGAFVVEEPGAEAAA